MHQTKASSNPSHSSLLHFTFSHFGARGCSKRANAKVWERFGAAISWMVRRLPAWCSEANSGHLLECLHWEKYACLPNHPHCPPTLQLSLAVVQNKIHFSLVSCQREEYKWRAKKWFWKLLLLKGQHDHLSYRWVYILEDGLKFRRTILYDD